MNGIEHINEVLHYMDEFPHGGQNREGAEIIRQLLKQISASSAPLVAVSDNWQPIETAPKGVSVMVYSPPTADDWPDSVRIEFDYIDPDSDGDHWYHHGERYEHFCCVAKPEGSTGPSENAPYTHWMPLPASPGVAGQVAPQATVEPLTDARIRGIAVIDAGAYQDDETAEWTFRDSDLMKFARALLATPPTSMATEPQSDRDADQIMAVLREADDEASLAFSAREMRGVLNLLSSERFMHKTAQERLDAFRLATSKADTSEIPPVLKFDPAGGNGEPYPSEARQYRARHGAVAWLVNPYTGERRDARDIGSDPAGLLIAAPGRALKSATPSTIKAEPTGEQK